MCHACRRVNCIIPPHLLRKLLESKDRNIREAALNTLLSTARMRGERTIRANLGLAVTGPASGRRTIYDCRGGRFLPNALLVRSEDGPPAADDSVNRAFDAIGVTRQFYREVFDRNSIDGRGRRLDGYVHYGYLHNNAFWDGEAMCFGDGDGIIFTDLTKSLDVVAHELTHGVSDLTAGLEYRMQPGALSESISDVFGVLVKQWSLDQSAEQADWLVGADVFTPAIAADALRSLKAPGTAYDSEDLGKDPQPDHMDRFVTLPDTEEGDNGGVHINSGIPNKAFYVVSMTLGGYAWQAPGHIWYEALKASVESTDFQEFADTTYEKAGMLYGATEQRAIADAWREVGIRITGVPAGAKRSVVAARVAPIETVAPAHNGLSLEDVMRRVEELAAQVKALT